MNMYYTELNYCMLMIVQDFIYISCTYRHVAIESKAGAKHGFIVYHYAFNNMFMFRLHRFIDVMHSVLQYISTFP